MIGGEILDQGPTTDVGTLTGDEGTSTGKETTTEPGKGIGEIMIRVRIVTLVKGRGM